MLINPLHVGLDKGELNADLLGQVIYETNQMPNTFSRYDWFANDKHGRKYQGIIQSISATKFNHIATKLAMVLQPEENEPHIHILRLARYFSHKQMQYVITLYVRLSFQHFPNE